MNYKSFLVFFHCGKSTVPRGVPESCYYRVVIRDIDSHGHGATTSGWVLHPQLICHSRKVAVNLEG